jgi:putative phosphoesterase
VSRLALISDIHGNGVALDAVLADIARRGVDGIVCLGDIAAGGPQPQHVLSQLRARQCVAVRGNADRWLLEGFPAGNSEQTRRLGDVVGWARDLLAPTDLDYLAALPPTLTISIGGRTLFCCHGSPHHDVDAILPSTPDARLDELFAPALAVTAFAFGHTHVQLFRPHRERLLVNPGSVGLPLRSLAPTSAAPRLPTWAEYALIAADEEDVEIVFRRLPIETAPLAAATATMPHATWASDLARRVERWNARDASSSLSCGARAGVASGAVT